MKKITCFLLLFYFLSGCDISNTESVPAQSSFLPDQVQKSSAINSMASLDTTRTDSSMFNGEETPNCVTCIDLPGDGDPVTCTVPEDYLLRASINNTTLSTISSDVPTWRLAPFWGSIINSLLTQIENLEQDYTFLYQDSPFHQTFDIDRRTTATTTLETNGQIRFSLTLHDMHLRVWFSNMVWYLSDARVEIEAEEIRINGIYTLAQDNFSISGIEFENLGSDVNSDTSFGPIIDFVAYLVRTVAGVNNSQIGGIIESELTDQIASAVDEVNRNSPNMFLRSFLDYPEIENVLPLLDQAISELLQDDVSATLNIALPSCGDIDRDGLIDLDISTN